MPTRKEREYYAAGYRDGRRDASPESRPPYGGTEYGIGPISMGVGDILTRQPETRKPKRKLSAWNKYVKANSKKPRFRYRNGKLNLKKMAVAFRKTSKRGKR